jgi:hypothetical protein
MPDGNREAAKPGTKLAQQNNQSADPTDCDANAKSARCRFTMHRRFQNSMQIANASQSHRQRTARVSDHAAGNIDFQPQQPIMPAHRRLAPNIRRSHAR